MSSKPLSQAPFRVGTSCFKHAVKYGAGHLEWPEKAAHAEWEVELRFPGGLFVLSFFGADSISNITATLNGYVNGIGCTLWRFICPLRASIQCRERCLYLYLGADNRWGCDKCAGFEYDHRRIRDMGIYRLMRHPEEIRRILGSPYARHRLKLRALEAAERLMRREERLKKKLERLRKEVARSRQQ